MPASQTSHSARVQPEVGQTGGRTLVFLLSGIFMISFSLLALEIALTRLLSVALSYHYVFAVLSLALLGLGMGGIFVHAFRIKMGNEREPFRMLAMVGGLYALSIPVSAAVMTRIAPMESLTGRLLLFWLLLFLPFFIAGILLAQIFRAFPGNYSRIYGADLTGAAAGSLGVIAILNAVGGVNAIFLTGLAAAAGATLFAIGSVRMSLKLVVFPAIAFLVTAGLLGTNLATSGLIDVPVGTDRNKSSYAALYHSPYGGQIAETRWSAFGRTDLVSFSKMPEAMSIFIDGDAGTPMYRFAGDFSNPDVVVANLKTEWAGYLGLAFLPDEQKDNALIIGPGGGRDVLVALMAGVRQVTAVEVNRELVEIVRDYSSYNGGIYSKLQNVSVVVDEGRSFLKRQTEKYDVIMLSLPVLGTSRSPEGFALAENFLFTTNSINDYLDHLTADGRLVVVGHNPEQMLKLLSVSLEALEQRGIGNRAAMKQIFIVGKDMYPLFVLKKTPFESAEMVSAHEALHQHGNQPELSWLPTIKDGKCPVHDKGIGFDQCNMFYPVFTALADGRFGIDEVRRDFGGLGLDLSAPTDNSPFFYKFETGIPGPVSVVLWPAVVLVLAMVPAYVMYYRRKIIPPRTTRSKPNVRAVPDLFKFAALFLMLGAGFMLAEVSAFQRFTLFLGQPVLSLAVLLFSLLAGAGIGSLYSGRIAPAATLKAIAILAASVSGLLVVFAFLQPFMINRLLGVPVAGRILITVGMMGALGFLMGFPFPLGLKLLKERGMEEHVPWMWGINGIASVLGSAMAIVLAMGPGLTAALFTGAACYFAVFLVFGGLRLGNSTR